LYRQRISDAQLAGLLFAGLLALAVALAATPAGRTLYTLAGGWLHDAWSVIAQWFKDLGG
jgi:hypothetical protein